MDDCVFPPANSAMDVDYMEELLLGGCWLETTDGSDFLNQIPPTSAGYYDPSLLWPMLEANGTSIASPSFRDVQEEGRRSDMLENSTVYDHEGGALVNNTSPSKSSVTIAGHSDQIGNLFADGSELNRMIWIAPSMNPSPAYSVMTRLMTALDYIKGSTKNKDVLIQIWVPIRRGGSNFLTTSEQPFSLLDPNCPKLIHYRKISEDFLFAADEVSKETLGLPGRVFVTKVPEWTPDVRFFRVEEYPRVGHAQQYDVRGTLALPVFEQGSRNCLGVVEVIMTTQKVNYRPELESVCKALEAVDLRSSDCWNVQHVKEHSSSYQAALPEILEVLKSACESHGLPLAQTWVPCIQQGKDGCRHSDENLIYCVSTVDSACFIADPQIRGFHEACSEHHLLKGQGVSGRAFLTNQPCFSEDIRTFSRTEYPLAHHARMFGICAAVAIRLRCVYTGTSDFVLEFFLPLSMRDPQRQEKMLSSLSVMLQQVCRSLRVVTELELEQESAVPVENIVVLPDDSPKRDKMETASKGENASLPLQEDCSATTFQQASTMSSVLTEDNSRELLKGKLPEQKQYRVESTTKVNSEPGGDCTLVGEGGSSNLGKSREKRRTKAEKNITLEVLRQHFAGSLKDAAKSIGVCPTTLKRICRQHGIKRWPSRKIKKVGHSLQKLQVVIDSVEGASGAFQIGSFYPNFPDRGSPNRLGNSPLSTEKPSSDLLQASRDEPENGSFSPQTVASKSPPSSCSQSSTSSSQCYSSGNQQQTSVWNAEDHLAGASSSECVLKRVKSEAEVCASRQDIKEHISRSQSQKSFSEHHDIGDNRPPLPKHVVGGLAVQEGNAWRVKVTYGEEKIRFRLLKGRGFKNVVQEVVKRFNIGDMGGFQLKYLDDDLEWVLLTCDADLEECIDIYRSSQRQTIKLSLQVSHSHSRSSVGSNGQL